jgi:biopolymer transport protein ExbD
VVWARSPWAETLGVYVDARGQFYVNGEPVARKELRSKLKEELGKRMVWTVYFQADEASRFGDTAYTIDTVQGLGAKFEWITPEVRKELTRRSAAAAP